MEEKATTNPPRAARWIIKSLSEYKKRFSLEGDLLEAYEYKVDQKGEGRAKIWYWSQTIKTLFLYWQLIIRGNLDMLQNYLKVSLRNIKRHKGYSFINVLGLSIGISSCILIFTFLLNELNYDSFHNNEDSLFRLVRIQKKPGGEKEIIAIHPVPLGPALLDEIPQMSHAVRIIGGNAIVSYGEKSFSERLTFVDTPFLEIFTFPLLKGDPNTALRNPQSIVLTEASANKYFGNEEPLRKSLILTVEGEQQEFMVTGVARNIPENSSITFDFLLPYANYPPYEQVITDWRSSRTQTYVKLWDKIESAEVEQGLPSFVSKYFGEMVKTRQKEGHLSQDEDAWQLHLQALRDIHINSKVKWGRTQTTNPVNLYILSGIALLLLLVACINFVTLAVGRSTNRAKEVGVRKVLGAFRKQLLIQYLGESLLLSFFALIMGMVFAKTFLLSFNNLLNKNLSINYGAGGISLLFLFALLFLVGIFAGSYPAVFLSAFSPVEALQANLKIGGKGLVTKSLVVVQYTLSIFLIISTLVIRGQLDYMRSKPLGYDKEQIIYIQTYSPWEGSEGARLLEIYRNELAGYPDIINMSGTIFSFTEGWSVEEWEHEGDRKSAFVYRIDQNYLDTLSIELLEGRNFSEKFTSDANEAIIVNEALVKQFEWDSGLGQRLYGFNNVQGFKDPTIIGVVKNFHFESLHKEIEPVILHANPSWPIQSILVKIRPENIPQTLALLRETWQKITSHKPFEYYFLNDDVDRQYKEEARWSKIVSYSSILAILISCLGLLGLTSLRVTQRTKEIGIRKILGASVPKVVKMISQEFITLVTMANLIAWPAAYFVMHRWIQNFAYRISIEIWIFLLATALAVLIAMATVCLLSINAALANPVQSLRYE